ncbi:MULTISPECIES: hypothetical protein [Kordiimonas]|jgi:hypothetical protein|uniref:hypothetical protein n=1 Tax=Kordiimonas TaxID=288021 RepID=UPI00257FF102|nr:hypothetical protein [Kordiimonas sp. UBA4487]
MNIIEIAGLDPAYRVYQAASGTLVRVKVAESPTDKAHNQYRFFLTAQVCDAGGQALQDPLASSSVVIELADLTAPTFSDASSIPATPGSAGELIRHDGQLYQYSDDEETWIHRGPIDPAASEAVAEVLAIWDQVARQEVEKAIRAAHRQAAGVEIRALIGAE